jgi:cell division protein FtsB
MVSALQVKLWVTSGMRDVWRLEHAVDAQAQENAKQQSKNEQLAAEVADLKEGAEAVEERARSELGMVKNGEIFYQVIEGASDSDQGATQQAETILSSQALVRSTDEHSRARGPLPR